MKHSPFQKFLFMHAQLFTSPPRLTGIDSDPNWIGKARDGSGRDYFRFSFADIGKLQQWGVPADTTLQKIPFNYQSSTLNNELEAFDFYLVDGRYRVACACASFLHAMGRGGDMSLVRVAVHDWKDRQYYWTLLDVAEIEHKSKSGRLAVLRLKPNATEFDIFNIWEKHIWDQR